MKEALYIVLELLRANKEVFAKRSAYERSEKAALELVKNDLQSGSKLFLDASYIVGMCCDITALSLQKALYYVQGFYHAFYESFIFEEDCQAWQHGPVYKEVYDRYKMYRYDQLVNENEVDLFGNRYLLKEYDFNESI